MNRQQLSEAKQYFQDALQKYEKLNPTSNEVVATHFHLATLFFLQDDINKTLQHDENIVEIIELARKNNKKLTQQQTSDLAIAHADLGYGYLIRRCLSKPFLKEDMVLSERHFIASLLNKDSYCTCSYYAYYGYGLFFYKQQKYLEAIKQFESILSLVFPNLDMLIPCFPLDGIILDSELVNEMKQYGPFKMDARIMACYFLIKCYYKLGQAKKVGSFYQKMRDYITEEFTKKRKDSVLAKRILGYVRQYLNGKKT